MNKKDKRLLMNISGILPLAFIVFYLILLIYAYASNTSNFAKTWFLALDSLMVSNGQQLTYHLILSAVILFGILGFFLILFIYLTKFKGEK